MYWKTCLRKTAVKSTVYTVYVTRHTSDGRCSYWKHTTTPTHKHDKMSIQLQDAKKMTNKRAYDFYT